MTEIQKLAEMFVWTGLASWNEFLALDPGVQAALVIAGRAKMLELAAAAGRSAASATEAKAILAEAGGPDASLDMVMADIAGVVRAMP